MSTTLRLAALVLPIAAGLALIAWWPFSEGLSPFRTPLASLARDTAGVLPLPPPPVLDSKKVALGRDLFSDRRLSADDTIACSSCHDLAGSGADNHRFSRGVGGATGVMNSPTVFNASLQVAQFWDGRAATLEEQVGGPLHNPIEMATDWPSVLAKLGRDKTLVGRFVDVYGVGPSEATIVDAIATFERTLLTPDSPLDRYLRGDDEALDARMQTGLRLFRELGCVSCHQGVNLGGNFFQRFGVMEEPSPARSGERADLGRFNVTGREEDRYVFKVPGLRNVALTAPYFHHGGAPTLSLAVSIMGRSQLGRELSGSEVNALLAFLEALTGKLPDSVLPVARQ